MVIAKTVKFKLPCKCLYISHQQWLFQHSKCFIRTQRKINSEKLMQTVHRKLCLWKSPCHEMLNKYYILSVNKYLLSTCYVPGSKVF